MAQLAKENKTIDMTLKDLKEPAESKEFVLRLLKKTLELVVKRLLPILKSMLKMNLIGLLQMITEKASEFHLIRKW